MMIKIYILILVLGLVGGAVYGGYYYYKDTQERIKVLTENSAKLEAAKQAQDNTIKTLKEDATKYRKLNKELGTNLQKAEKYKNNLIGYCVVKLENKFNLNIVWIMDIVLIKKYIQYYSRVLNMIALNYMETSDFISSLLPNREYIGKYIKSGYFKVPSFIFPHNFYFCVKKNNYNNRSILELKNWFMSWGLNDVL